MTSALHIQKVTEKTFSDFTTLLVEMACYEHQNPPDKHAQQRLNNDLLGSQPKLQAYLALYKQTAIGYVITYYTYSSYQARPTLYIEDLYIQQDYRRKGFGQQLFEFCLNQAKKQNCGRMQWNVYRWNTPAIQFYEKNNAQQLNKNIYQITLHQ